MKKLFTRLTWREAVGVPMLVLSMAAFKRIQYWTKQAALLNREVSGLGLVSELKDYYYVSEAWVIKPERIGGAHVHMDPMAIQERMFDLFQRGKRLSQLRFLWHSHANFGVGWSRDDDETARDIFGADSPWTINLVTNSKGSFLARMDFPSSKEEPIHDLPVRLEIPVYAPMERKLELQYAEAHIDLVNVVTSPSVISLPGPQVKG